jgi:hypothetical protein
MRSSSPQEQPSVETKSPEPISYSVQQDQESANHKGRKPAQRSSDCHNKSVTEENECTPQRIAGFCDADYRFFKIVGVLNSETKRF